MKAFLLNILKLTLIITIILIVSLLYIPDKSVKYSILGAYPDKHAILKQIKSKKIILLGGSNLSFGINSKQIEIALKKPVRNMGIHAGVGLEFMINDIKPYLKKGDTLILVPEYEHFYTDNFYGEIELVSLIFDIEPKSKQLINTNQWLHLLKYLPTYSAKKIKNYLPSLIQKRKQEINIYHRNSFNKYGDAYLHWKMENQNYQHASKETGNEVVNNQAISFLKNFNLYTKQNGITLLIFPPVIDKTSFENTKMIISKISKELNGNHIGFVSEPKNYAYDNNLFFNSYYHLNRKGVDKRTQQFINDLLILKSE